MLSIDGDHSRGENVRHENAIAAQAISNVVKTSFGPVGLDKMMVDKNGDVLITNDGATILARLDTQHPTAKVLIELARLQDREVGDGTTSVVILAAELLRRAAALVDRQQHATAVIGGFQRAADAAKSYIQDVLSIPTKGITRDMLVKVAETALASKVVGNSADPRFFAELVVDALLRVVSGPDENGAMHASVKAVNILKSHGGSVKESELVHGYALNNTCASKAMPKLIKGAKIACLDLNLQRGRLGLTVSVQVSDPEKLEAMRKREEEVAAERAKKVLDAGANVILTSEGIDDLSLKYFVEAGAMAVRRVDKGDLMRIAKATGATVLVSLANAEDGEEVFDPAHLGTCDEVEQVRYADDECLIFRGESMHASSLILRGPNHVMLDEVHRSLHDALCIVKRTIESGSVIAGGGATDVALSVYLDRFANTLDTREQLAVKEFADALLVIPKTLAINAAQDALDLVAQLRAHHHVFAEAVAKAGGKKPEDEAVLKEARMGLDLINGVVRDNYEAGVLEPAMSKEKIIKFATEAAINILRIDESIKINPKPKVQNRGEDDEMLE